MEQRALAEHRGGRVRALDAQLEPGEAGQPHLGSQQQHPALVDVLDPPPVEGVAWQQVVGVATAADQSWPAGEAVDPAADLPAEGERVPAALAADALDDVPERRRRRVDLAGPLVAIQRAAGPVR